MASRADSAQLALRGQLAGLEPLDAVAKCGLGEANGSPKGDELPGSSAAAWSVPHLGLDRAYHAVNPPSTTMLPPVM